MKQFAQTRRHETGVALVLALLLLLVITMLGVGAINAATSQSLIVQNNQYKVLAFQNAETTLSLGEQSWDAILNDCLNYGLCPVNHLPSQIDHPVDWDSLPLDTPFFSVDEYHGEYIVEYLGLRAIAGESNKIHFYRITARAQDGRNGGAVTQLQSIFRKCINQDGLPCSTMTII